MRDLLEEISPELGVTDPIALATIINDREDEAANHNQNQRCKNREVLAAFNNCKRQQAHRNKAR